MMIEILFYLIGCVVAYIAFKSMIREDGWTVGERSLSLLASTLSWFMVALVVLINLAFKLSDLKKPSKW
jgi:hypothetical protein